VRVGVISCRISACYFPLPLVPSRRGRGKFTFYEFIINDSQMAGWELADQETRKKIKGRGYINPVVA